MENKPLNTQIKELPKDQNLPNKKKEGEVMSDYFKDTTLFAPARRATTEQLNVQRKIFLKNKLLLQFSNSISQMLVLLNQERQIIFANNQFTKSLFLHEITDYLGKRTGEVLSCAHAVQSSGGCGTTEFCRKCGAVNAILEAQKGIQSTKECRITTLNNEALDLEVTATPIAIEQEHFSIFEMKDISHVKRRQSLERIFFHDVLNSAGGISGLSDVLCLTSEPDEMAEVAHMINKSADNLIYDIQSQRQLSAAEHNDLELQIGAVGSYSLLKTISELYSNHEVTGDRQISIDQQTENFTFETDIALLRRILGNMTKNALEAASPKSTITLCAQKENDSFIFSVHNPGYIERDIQLQLFKRSFSTKGIGRGLGTYSMKLFGEKYLKGKVWFESDKEKGTTFFIRL